MSVRSLEDKELLKGEHHKLNRRTIHLTVLNAVDTIVSNGRGAQQNFENILFSGFSDFEYK